LQGATLIEPDWRIARIRLSDQNSRLHPRRATTKLGQAYEAEVLVKVREWIRRRAIEEAGIEFVFDQDGKPAGILLRGARLDLSSIQAR
jgi:hypothetical protein